MWSGSEAGRQKLYDCDYCQRSDLYRKRNCFWFGEEKQDVEIFREVVGEGGEVIFCRGEVCGGVTSDSICDDLIPLIQDIHRNDSAFKILIRFISKVCPKSLITSEIDNYVLMEMMAKEYSVKPYGDNVGFLDYPYELLNVFSVIVATRERVKLEQLKEAQANMGAR